MTLKHFPGDGVDGRDHHVVKTANTLKMEDWYRTFGKVYQENINNGATGVMVGHIALPDYFEADRIEFKDVPASLNPYLIKELLRKELGFNGLIITDSSLMTGFGVEGKRRDLVPRAIASGNDMILFAKNVKEDFEFMMEGIRSGVVTEERLQEALLRILGLKASLNLHLEQKVASITNNPEAKKLAQSVADEAITLVKDTQKLLPISPLSHKKIGIISLGNDMDVLEMLASSAKGLMKIALKLQKKKPITHEYFGDLLKERGYDISYIDHSDISVMMSAVKQSIKDFTNEYDLIIYFIKKDTASNQTNLRVEFKSLGGFDSPWFIHEVPTMMISVANPYHGYDLSDVMTEINGYSPTDDVIRAIVDKIEGKSEFKGKSPVRLDYKPFLGDIDSFMNEDI